MLAWHFIVCISSPLLAPPSSGSASLVQAKRFFFINCLRLRHEKAKASDPPSCLLKCLLDTVFFLLFWRGVAGCLLLAFSLLPQSRRSVPSSSYCTLPVPDFNPACVLSCPFCFPCRAFVDCMCVCVCVTPGCFFVSPRFFPSVPLVDK